MGKQFTWDLQANASAVSVKLIWIKTEKPVAKTGEVASQAQKKKYLSPSIRKRNAQRITQWKAKRNEAVGDNKTYAQTQTDDSNSHIDEMTQTDQQQSRPSPPQTNYINTKKGVIDPDLTYNHRQAIDAYEIS